MPRGVLQGEPESLGVPPWERRAGEACLVLARHPEDGSARPAAMRWGLPRPQGSGRYLAVRVDQLGPRRLSRHGRCLIPLGGYVQRGARRSRIAVAAADGAGLAAAGLWRDGAGGPAFALVTTTPNEVLAMAHGSMPVLLPPGLWALWLAERAPTAAEFATIAQPAEAAALHAAAVPKGAARMPSLSVARQLAEWAPGTTLWRPVQNAEAPRLPPPGEVRQPAG